MLGDSSLQNHRSEWTDERLENAVQVAELPALLVTLAHITGDMSLVDSELRPIPEPAPGALPRNGGMTREQEVRARELGLAALRKFRDEGFSVQKADQDRLIALLGFFSEGVGEEYIPLLRQELNYPEDTGSPTWQWQQLAPERTFKVAIVGAGESGLVATHRLVQAGLGVTVFERNLDVGGVWWENTYPGCRLDTPNFDYSFSFAQRADWPDQYSTGPEIQKYFRRVAEEFDLLRHIRFGMSVTKLEFLEDEAMWEVTSVDSEGNTTTERFNGVISAMGQLNEPLIPDLPGLSSFEGSVMHTARWDHSVQIAGKKVAVVGTGASAFQVIPEIAPDCDRLMVFQRTAPWMYPTPGYRDEIPEDLQWLFTHLPFYARWYRFFQFWASVEGRRAFMKVDPEWNEKDSVSQLNDLMRQTLIAYFEEQFADRPDLLPKVIPDYPPGAKRMLRDDGVWGPTLMRDNVSLVTSGIREFTPTGVITNDGEEFELDVVVLGTGFRASDFLPNTEVIGRDGLELHDFWQGDARAYAGISIPGFPNLFCLYGPNTNLVVNGSILLFSELATNYLLSGIRELAVRGANALDIKTEPFREFQEIVDQDNRNMAWGASNANTWYKNKFGRVSQNWGGSTFGYWELTKEINPSNYEFLGG